MYRWAPDKRTRVQTEPAPRICVRPLEFDRIREGQNPPPSHVSLCVGHYKAISLGLISTRLYHAADPLLYARQPLSFFWG